MRAKPRTLSVDSVIHSYRKTYPDEVVPSTKIVYAYIHQGLLEIKPIDLPRVIRLKPRIKKPSSTKNHISTSIETNLEVINDCSEFGHWEIDSVLGLQRVGEPSILTLVKRKSRYGITLKGNTFLYNFYKVFFVKRSLS